MIKSIRVIGIIGIIALTLWSCGEDNDSKKTDIIEETVTDEINISRSDKVQYQRAKIVLFSLPSPMETAKVLKKSGAIYDSKYLNPVENIDKHETTKGKAIAMGIYVADLSYANVFKQQQACLDYFSVMSKLADDLSLSEVFTKDFVEKIDNNISNEDSVLEYLTESYLRANSELKADDRESVAGLIAAGGWIEGLYIATHLIDPNNLNDPVSERIAEQGASLKQLIKFLSSFRDDKNLLEVTRDLEELEKLFDQIEVERVRVEASTDADGVAVVGKKKVYKFKGTLLNDIIEQTKIIRNKYV